MRKFRVVFCVLAMSAVAHPVWADPIQAPGAEVPSDPLLALVDQAITVTRKRNLDFQVHTPWQILHGLLASRSNYTLKNGSEFVNALDFISTRATFKGERWFQRTAIGGRAHPYNGTPYDFEGHVNQTLAILAMCDLPLTHQFTLADGSKITMADLVRNAQWTVSSKEETTWTLWLLTHYLDQDASWTNSERQKWSMESLVRIQTAASPYNAPCGGCHSLFALAYARNAYLQKHGKLRGSWLEADQKVQKYVSAAQSMQNRDGSFATQFFKARGFSHDFNERINASGHILEFLMVALSRKRLDERWVRAAVQTLSNDLIRNAAQPADCGPLYHSLHALILYRQRVTPDKSPAAPEELAKNSTNSTTVAGPVSGPGKHSGLSSEARPHSEKMQKELAATAEAIIGKSKVTASTDSHKVTPGTTSKSGSTNTDASQSKSETAATGTSPSDKSAGKKSTPQLLAPNMTITPALKPLKVVEQPENLKRLSGEKNEDEPDAQQADESALEETLLNENLLGETLLSPVPGGMPILKRSYVNAKEAAKEKQAETGTDPTSEKNQNNETSTLDEDLEAVNAELSDSNSTIAETKEKTEAKNDKQSNDQDELTADKQEVSSTSKKAILDDIEKNDELKADEKNEEKTKADVSKSDVQPTDRDTAKVDSAEGQEPNLLDNAETINRRMIDARVRQAQAAAQSVLDSATRRERRRAARQRRLAR